MIAHLLPLLAPYSTENGGPLVVKVQEFNSHGHVIAIEHLFFETYQVKISDYISSIARNFHLFNSCFCYSSTFSSFFGCYVHQYESDYFFLPFLQVSPEDVSSYFSISLLLLVVATSLLSMPPAPTSPRYFDRHSFKF